MSVYIAITVILLLIAGLWVTLEGRLLPRKSTRDYWHLSDLPRAKKLEGYIYGARTEWYLKPATWNWLTRHYVSNEKADTYHGKMLTHADAVKLININEPLELLDLDHVIPYPVAKSIILRDPLPSLAVLDCPCRAQKKDSCRPHDVCLIVGEPFTSFIVDHRPHKARRITAGEALDILEAEEKRGHVHTAWFKDVMHNRFYVICNCCSCCCLGMQSYFRGIPRLTHSGYCPQIDEELCSVCGNCAAVCPFQAITINAELPKIDHDICMGCGLCVSHCPTEAVSLQLARHKGTPLNIEQLKQ